MQRMHHQDKHDKPSDLVQLGGLLPTVAPTPFEIDPVCKMRVLPETAAAKFDYNGKTYYFCATRCMERFKADPSAFLKSEPQKAVQAPSDVVYTCPMHPEVRQKG